MVTDIKQLPLIIYQRRTTAAATSCHRIHCTAGIDPLTLELPVVNTKLLVPKPVKITDL